MRTKTMYAHMPPPYTVDRGGKNTAIITFAENAEQVGEEVMADVYMLEAPWTHDIIERVENNYTAWLAHAKAIDFEAEAAKVREQRDTLLGKSDWTQAPDVPFVDNEREEWLLYRQALRDVPQQEGFPYAVVWPDKP